MLRNTNIRREVQRCINNERRTFEAQHGATAILNPRVVEQWRNLVSVITETVEAEFGVGVNTVDV